LIVKKPVTHILSSLATSIYLNHQAKKLESQMLREEDRKPLWMRIASQVLLVTLIVSESSFGILAGKAYASPIANPSAPIVFRPIVITSPNGVPIVNIAKPNDNGLSYNQFSAFDVDAIGLILNNSLVAGGSLLGGAVGANPNLSGRSASLIINDVTSNRSFWSGGECYCC
jgi:filamentous hemagglutinin